MEFLDRLDKEQEQNALLIARKAKQMGIEPRLAVALAYQESGLRMPEKPGGAGEIGIMQVRPTTAKMMGFDPKELESPERNIEIGLTYLKQGLDKFNDPVLAVAGYNAGMDHPYFTDPQKQSLPESTKTYVKSINGMGAFAAPAAPAEEAPGPAPAAPGGVTVSEDGFQIDKARALVGGMGALAGSATAKGLDVLGEYGKNKAAERQAFRDIADVLKKSPPGAPATSGEKWSKNWAGQSRPGVGGVPEASAAYQRSKGQGPVTSKMTKMWGPPMPGEPTALVDRLIARGQTPPPPTPLQQAGSAVKGAAGAALRSPMLTGGLGGLGAAEMGMQFMERVNQKDPIGAAITGVGALGGLASMAPFPPVKAVGLGLSAASPLTLYLYDKMKTQPYPEPLGIREAYMYGPQR